MHTLPGASRLASPYPPATGAREARVGQGWGVLAQAPEGGDGTWPARARAKPEVGEGRARGVPKAGQLPTRFRWEPWEGMGEEIDRRLLLPDAGVVTFSPDW